MKSKATGKKKVHSGANGKKAIRRPSPASGSNEHRKGCKVLLQVDCRRSDGPYTTYLVIHTLPDGTTKGYVGVTVLTLKARLMAHFYNVSRTGNRKEGSQGQAIQHAFARNQMAACFAIPGLQGNDLIKYARRLTYAEFTITELQICTSKDQAKLSEAYWIEQLGTKTPNGYNIMPGGSSLGGPSNSIPLTIFDDEGEHEYSSMAEIARELARERCEDPDRLYSRAITRVCAYGWPFENAFDLIPRQDGRRTPLSIRARESGEKLSTLRSREYRRTIRERNGRSESGRRLLPHPGSPYAQKVSAKAFARLTGVPASTVCHRVRQLSESIERLKPEEIVSHLLRSQDRSHLLSVKLCNGTTVCGSKNELAKTFARDRFPEGRYCEATIRAYLRKLDAHPSNEAVLNALGLPPTVA